MYRDLNDSFVWNAFMNSNEIDPGTCDKNGERCELSDAGSGFAKIDR